MVGTRTPKQVRTHAQKYEMRLVRESTMRSYTSPQEPFSEADTDSTTAAVPEADTNRELGAGSSDSLDEVFSEINCDLQVPTASGLDSFDPIFDDELNMEDTAMTPVGL